MARVAHILSEEDGYEALVLLDEESGDSLEFQRELPVMNGEDGRTEYCVVRSAGPVAYDAVLEWAVYGDELAIELTAEGAELLSLPKENRISLEGADAVLLVQTFLGQIVGKPSGPG